MDEEEILGIMSMGRTRTLNSIPAALLQALYKLPPAEYEIKTNISSTKSGLSQAQEVNLTPREHLEIMKIDITRDIAGDLPLSGLNYVWITIRMMVLFIQIEDRLKTLNNATYLKVYESPHPMMQKEKRLGPAAGVLFEQNEQAMRAIAEEFQNPRAGLMNHIYWEGLYESMRAILEGRPGIQRLVDPTNPPCSPM